MGERDGRTSDSGRETPEAEKGGEGDMTIDFDAIKVHDLVYLNDQGESGWYIVTDVRVGHHIEVRVLGEFYPLIFLDREELGTIHKVIRIAAVPGAIEALERLYKEASEIEACGSGMFHAGAVANAEEALRAVRGEESA